MQSKPGPGLSFPAAPRSFRCQSNSVFSRRPVLIKALLHQPLTTDSLITQDKALRWGFLIPRSLRDRGTVWPGDSGAEAGAVSGCPGTVGRHGIGPSGARGAVPAVGHVGPPGWWVLCVPPLWAAAVAVPLGTPLVGAALPHTCC